MARVARLLAPALAALALPLLAASCGDTFAPASEISSLRVLAVQKSAPYAKPGAKVRMSMLLADGSAARTRPVEITWLGGCVNPSGDLYYGCFQQLSATLSGLASGTPDPATAKLIGRGPTFSVDVPSDIITSRPTLEGQTPYGLIYVFFAACAGHLGPAPAGAAGLPIGCFDDAGRPLGADDFVPGYSAIYAYDGRTNANPEVGDLLVDGKAMTGEVVHVPSADHTLTPLVARSSAEADPGAAAPDGTPLGEQLWLDWYVDSGSVSHSLRLVNDAQKGWNDDLDTVWTPGAPGLAHLWVVVHDNRGGTAWRERRVVVDP